MSKDEILMELEAIAYMLDAPYFDSKRREKISIRLNKLIKQIEKDEN